MGDCCYGPAQGVRDGMTVGLAAFESLARPPGWKYELLGGRLALEPDWRHTVARLVGPRSEPCALPGIVLSKPTLVDAEDALRVADEAFRASPDFFGFPPETQRAALAEGINDALRLEPVFTALAHRIARTDVGEAVGLLLVREVMGGVALNTVAVRPAWRRRGLAAAMLAEALRALPAGVDVRSQWLVANRESAAWHARVGFEPIETSISMQSAATARRWAEGGGWQTDPEVQRLRDAEQAGEAPDPFSFADPIHTRRTLANGQT